jgi:pilus assembly protein Flp/PilA
MLFAPKEKGQGLVEYALILVLVAVVVIVILALLGPASEISSRILFRRFSTELVQFLQGRLWSQQSLLC